MADIRIKDLTTTASTSASDDFVAVDGTTNGTRKLNAYSPSFGGNATVGGTLTVSGTSASSVSGSLGIGTTSPTGYAAKILHINDTSGSTSAGIKLTNNTSGATNDDGLDITMSGTTAYIIQRENASLILQTNGLTAMTLNNSQGAVISGTTDSTTKDTGCLVLEGGLGVEKSANIGGALNVLGTADSSIAGLLYVASTAVSNSSITGAIITLGGLGVGKRIYSGGGLNTAGDNDTHISLVRNGTINIGPDSSVTPTLVISSGIKTAAPAGGTAANWKLGTVASVSPTSPNRTIEVDIGGTIYYIHAKTTNN